MSVITDRITITPCRKGRLKEVADGKRIRPQDAIDCSHLWNEEVEDGRVKMRPGRFNPKCAHLSFSFSLIAQPFPLSLTYPYLNVRVFVNVFFNFKCKLAGTNSNCLFPL